MYYLWEMKEKKEKKKEINSVAYIKFDKKFGSSIIIENVFHIIENIHHITYRYRIYL